MALTTNHPNNELIKFRRNVATDFLRASRFDPFMGSDPTNPIVRMSDLAGDGKEIRIPLVTQLVGSGVGVGTLVGAEERSTATVCRCGQTGLVTRLRTTVLRPRKTRSRSNRPHRACSAAGRVVSSAMILVDSLLSIPTSQIQANRFTSPGNRVNGIKWSAATAGNKNSWVTANVDRVVFGSVISNYSTTFATAAANVDSTNDKMTAAVGSLMKNVAQQTGVSASNPGVYNGKPKITPFSIKGTNNDQEWYLCLLGSRAMRDLKADPTMYQANRDARERESGATKNNPIFTGGGLIYDGVIYLEIPEITQRLLLSGIGASSIDVEPVFLLGQSALGYVMGQMPRPTRRDETDYDFIKGIGIEAQYGVGKIAKAPQSVGSAATVGDLIDWGMVTGFVSGVANA
jgi:hypothetical protein